MKSRFPKWLLVLFFLIVVMVVLYKSTNTLQPGETNPTVIAEQKPAVNPSQQLRSSTIKTAPYNPRAQSGESPQADPASEQSTAADKPAAESRRTVSGHAQSGSKQKLNSSSLSQQIANANSPRSNPSTGQASDTQQPVATPVDFAATKEKAQQLAAAAAQGDVAAIKALEDLNSTLRQAVFSDPRSMKQPDETDSRERDAFITDSFKPIRDAIDALKEEAGKGNQNALDALARAAQARGLQGFAVDAIGKLAADGNKSALDALIHPDQYGLLLSTTVGALKPAADGGNQQAIDALIAITGNPKNQALWFMAAHGLGTAAGAGNETAIDALIPLLQSPQANIRNAAISGLQRAKKNRNEKATAALRALDPNLY